MDPGRGLGAAPRKGIVGIKGGKLLSERVLLVLEEEDEVIFPVKIHGLKNQEQNCENL